MAERSSRTHKRANVPEIYRKAAKILKSSEERKGSIKNLIYNSGFRVSLKFTYCVLYFTCVARLTVNSLQDVKPLYALCAEACKHQNALDEFIRNTAGLNADPPTVDPHLAKVLITELVFGKGYLKPENARAIRIILELESQLKNSLLGLQSNSADESKHPPGRRQKLIFFFLFFMYIYSAKSWLREIKSNGKPTQIKHLLSSAPYSCLVLPCSSCQ